MPAEAYLENLAEDILWCLDSQRYVNGNGKSLRTLTEFRSRKKQRGVSGGAISKTESLCQVTADRLLALNNLTDDQHLFCYAYAAEILAGSTLSIGRYRYAVQLLEKAGHILSSSIELLLTKKIELPALSDIITVDSFSDYEELEARDINAFLALPCFKVEIEEIGELMHFFIENFSHLVPGLLTTQFFKDYLNNEDLEYLASQDANAFLQCFCVEIDSQGVLLKTGRQIAESIKFEMSLKVQLNVLTKIYQRSPDNFERNACCLYQDVSWYKVLGKTELASLQAALNKNTNSTGINQATSFLYCFLYYSLFPVKNLKRTVESHTELAAELAAAKTTEEVLSIVKQLISLYQRAKRYFDYYEKKYEVNRARLFNTPLDANTKLVYSGLNQCSATLTTLKKLRDTYIQTCKSKQFHEIEGADGKLRFLRFKYDKFFKREVVDELRPNLSARRRLLQPLGYAKPQATCYSSAILTAMRQMQSDMVSRQEVHAPLACYARQEAWHSDSNKNFLSKRTLVFR